MPDLQSTIRAMTLRGVITDSQAAAMMEFAAPADSFGKFKLVEKLGEGGMGEVWKAWQADLGRWVALKFVKGADAEDVERFIREAQLAAKLSHPSIVSTHEAGEHEGRHYISMDFIEGDDLKKRRVDVKQALTLIHDAAEAVHYAHRQGIVHRDLKPANLMLGEDGRVRVMDFGLAKGTTGLGLSVTGTIVGTPAYMAPEQARGEKVDARADVYSLGATLYELVTGHAPFEGETVMEVLRKVDSEDPAPPRKLNPKLGGDVETIVLKCLEKEPAKRYATAKELADELERELRGEPISARPIGTIGPLVKKAKRNRPAAAAIGVLALLVFGIGIGLVVSSISWASRIAERKAAARKAEPEAALPIWAELRGLAPNDLEVVEQFTKLTAEVERIRRARELFAAAKFAGNEEREGRARIDEARKKLEELSRGIETWDPPKKKINKWNAEREIRVSSREVEIRWYERWAILSQVLAVMPQDREASIALADACWERFLEDERKGDKTMLLTWSSLTAVHDYGKYDEQLEMQGRLSLSTTPQARATAYRYQLTQDTRLLTAFRSVDPDYRLFPYPDEDDPIDLGTTPISAALPAGSYLVILSAPGYRDTRYPVLIERGKEWKGDVPLYTDAEIGEGWVYVPGGPFIAGGDPSAPQAWGKGVSRVDGFFVSKFEVTMEQYEAFVNDLIATEGEEKAKAHLPRNTDQSPLWKIQGGKAAYDESGKPWPALGVSWNDADAYCKWRSAKDPDWDYRPPTEEQWEKAARGVDGRFFPWGNAFDWAFTKGGLSREGKSNPERIGAFGMDESPYGVRDLGGGVQEWCDGWFNEVLKHRPVRGGAFTSIAPFDCRSASRLSSDAMIAHPGIGFRLVRAPEGF